VQATVPLNSPSPGEYLLIWFLFDGNESAAEVKDSYSPGILCTVGNPGEDPTPAISGKARRYLAAIREERRNLDVTARPRRPELWLAAIRMGLSKPLLGIGPDNFRLRKWEFMEVPKGDDTILANSLYLETLAGSGLSGLACLLWLLWEFSRRIAVKALTATSPSERVGAYFGTAYLAGLLSHGIVDYFLKFTPIFLMFWLLLGMLCADRGED
jgi:O-antigen ligase